MITKILKLLKSKIKLLVKKIPSEEAEKIISNFNKPSTIKSAPKKVKPSKKIPGKTKK